MTKRRDFLGVVFPASAVTSSGCLFSSTSEQATKIIFRNKYDSVVELNLRIEHEKTTVLSDSVTIESGQEKELTPFEQDERYVVHLEATSSEIDVNDLDSTIIKACGDEPSVYIIEESGKVAAGLAGCGA